MSSVQWQPIEDLPPNWSELRSPDLESLAQVWKDQAVKLQDSAALKQFNERLSRQWAIETGIIENIYSIDRGTTQLLIEKGIETALIPYGTTDQPAEKIVPILRAQQEALEGLFSFVKQSQELSNFYIRQLHQVLTRQQPTVTALDQFGNVMEVRLAHGEWKRLPNNPTRPDGLIHQYSPPEQVQVEMDRLIELHRRHDEQNVPPEVEAAWLHHRFTQVHPFQDGNGRVARALATLILLRAGWFPLVVTRDDRSAYIDALEQADDGDLKPLIDLIANLQKKAIIRALSLSQDVLDKEESLQEVILSIGIRLGETKDLDWPELKQGVDLSKYLQSIAEKNFALVIQSLNHEFDLAGADFTAKLKTDDSYGPDSLYIGSHAQTIAKQLGYKLNNAFFSVRGLEIIKGLQSSSELILAFHAIGGLLPQIMAVSAFVLFPSGTSPEAQVTQPISMTDEVFEFTYNENQEALVGRFDNWLNKAMVNALKLWRRQIF